MKSLLSGFWPMGLLVLLVMPGCNDDSSGSDDNAVASTDGNTDANSDAGGDTVADKGTDPGVDTGADSCAGGPLKTSIPNCQPVLPTPTGDYYQDCVNTVNAFRAQCQCLPPYEYWTDGETCADQQAEYDFNAQSAHAGFSNDICEGGWAQCECPGWDSPESITQGTKWMEPCLEMMWHEVDDPSGEQGHYKSMSSTKYSKLACGIFVGDGGETWALQNYR